MIVTPGDILARCRALDARIDTATKAITSATLTSVDQPFRDAWNVRLRRWAEIREQCGDWASRWWNYKWGPILDDWTSNQTTWEQDIERRIGHALPVPAQVKPSEDPTLPKLPDLGSGLGVGVGVGLVAVLGLAALGLSRTKR